MRTQESTVTRKLKSLKIGDVTKRACKGFHIILNDTNIAAPAQTGVSDTGMVLACARLALNDAESWSTMSVWFVRAFFDLFTSEAALSVKKTFTYF